MGNACSTRDRPPSSIQQQSVAELERSISPSGSTTTTLVDTTSPPSIKAKITTPPPSPEPSLSSSPPSSPAYPWSTRPLNLLPPVVLSRLRVGAIDPSSESHPSPSPFPRAGHSLTSTPSQDGQLFLFGGGDGSAKYSDLYAFLASERSMKLIQTSNEVPSARTGHASALISSVLIVWGGDTRLAGEPEALLDDGLYLLNLVTREWTRIRVEGPSPKARYGHVAFIVGTKFYVFGGQADEGSFRNDLWVFDLNTLRNKARWELVNPDASGYSTSSPSRRAGHSCVTFGSKIYVFGGKDTQSWYNDTWCFDANTGEWSELPCIGFIPSPREGHAAALVDDIMYIFGGRGVDGSPLADLVAFRIIGQRWFMFKAMGPAPSARSGLAMSAVGTQVFVLGGDSPSSSGEDDNSVVHVLETKYIKYPQQPNKRKASSANDAV